MVSPQSKMSLSDVKPVYLRLPWKGELVSRNFQHQVKSAVESSYHDVSVRFVYTTVRAFTVKKDALPTSQQSHVIYQFECRHCESRYVGRTLLHLNARIRQHVPLHLVPVSQRASRPRRGRQPKGDDGRPPRKPPDGQAVCRMTRSSSGGVRCRLNNVSSNLRFLSECLFRGVVPKRISIRVKKMRAHHSLKLERAMIRDEISKVSEEKEKLRLKYRYMSEVRSFLGCWDFVRFCRMVGECDDKQRRKCMVKYSRNIDW